MIVYLPEMIGQMSHQMDHEVRPAHPALGDELWIRSAHGRIVRQFQGSLHRGNRGIDAREQFGTRHVASREFGFAVADIPVAPDDGADEVPDVSSDVERRRARGVGSPRDRSPDAGVVWIGFDLAPYRAQLARDEKLERGCVHDPQIDGDRLTGAIALAVVLSGLEDALDRPAEKPGDPERQREARIVLASLDGIHRLA